MALALKERSSSRTNSRTGTTVIYGDLLTAASLAALLEIREGFEVLSGASDFDQLIDELSHYKPQVLLYNASHHVNRAISPARLQRIKEASPLTEIVVVSSGADPLHVRQALRSGILSYVIKSDGVPALLHAVRRAPQGVSYVNPRLGAEMVRMPEIVNSELGGKEREVLRLVALGYTNRQIAAKMDIAVRTVEAHRSRITIKMGFADRAELVRYALDSELIG